jgi:hypothetical protein
VLNYLLNVIISSPIIFLRVRSFAPKKKRFYLNGSIRYHRRQGWRLKGIKNISPFQGI